MIYALVFILYVQNNLDVRVQEVKTQAIFSSETACNTAASTKSLAFAIPQGSQPSWRIAKCVPIPNDMPQSKIQEGFDGL